MIQDTIGKMQATIRNAEAISETRREELLQLLGKLELEVAELSKTHVEDARSIAAFAQLSAQEATRITRNPKLLKISLEGLDSSVKEFEDSHPRLVMVVDAISQTLAKMGI